MSTLEHPIRAGAKRKRTSQELSEDIAWTAARCNRLLRTISSRINTLRRLIRTDAGINAKAIEKAKLVSRQTEHWSTADPVWLPNGAKKSKGRTYTAKKKVAEPKKQREEKPISLAFPSPFVRRIGRDWNPASGESPIATRIELVSGARRSRQLPIKSNSEVQEAEKGLQSALINLLSQTEPSVQPRESGTRSLFSACLRKVPSYVELEIESTAGQDEAESITSDVLSYLEDMGSKSGGGWSALAEVVRSHGIHLICGAIEEGLIQDDIIDSLAISCSARGQLSEGQQIFRAFLFSTERPGTEIAVRLHEFCMMHHCQEYKYEMLCDLGETDASILTNALDVPGFCDALLGRLAISPTTTAWRYIFSTAFALQDLEQSSSSMTRHSSLLKSIVARIAAMACAGFLLGQASSRGPALFEALNRLAAGAIIASEPNLRSLSSNSAQLILSSEFLLALERSSREPDLILSSESLSDALGVWSTLAGRRAQWRSWRQDFVTELAESLIALDSRFDLDLVAQLLGRVLEVSRATMPARGLLQELSLAIISDSHQSVSLIGKTASADFLQRLASITQKAASPKTPYRESQNSKFRWEDGLSEWVLATPFVRKPSVDSDEGTDSSPQQAACVDSMFDSGHHSSPRMIIAACSPDILAMSPPLKPTRRPTYSPIVKDRKRRRPKVETQVSQLKIRKSRRISNKENEDSSSDELGH